MIYVEAPNTCKEDGRSIFIAGGITGCENWQNKLVDSLKYEKIIIYNPRRNGMQKRDKDIKEEQITWEYNHLRKADAISFWFPGRGQCPITLYELGAWSMTEKQIFVGVDKDFWRKADVEFQTKLVRPDIVPVNRLSDLSKQIKDWLRTRK